MKRDYSPAASATYADATRPMYSVCMGTHGTLDVLILPPGVW